MKQIISYTILTALTGILVSGIVPRLPTPEFFSSHPTTLVDTVETQNVASLQEVRSVGFERLSPTIIPDTEKDKTREYQKKVALLLHYMDKATQKGSGSTAETLPDDPPATPFLQAIITPAVSVAPAVVADSQQLSPAYLGELQKNPLDSVVRIAVLGDSMVDTLGKDLPDLRQLLQSRYPDKTFALFNYGQGATNLDQGCARLTETTTYLDTTYPPLLTYQPTILVLESFAYNHWSSASHDLDRQWITIAHCLDTVKKQSPATKVLLAATIDPDVTTVGDGKLNWPTSVKKEWTATTRAYLQNMLRFAASEKYPIADAFTPSQGTDGNGKAVYINPADHLHPSEEGKKLFSKQIMEAIEKGKLIP